MADNLPPAPEPLVEVGNSTTVTNIGGGVNINAQGDVHISGDVVGRDKITYTVIPRDKNLSILLEKVRTFWIEDVLENSVHHAALIELGKQVQADAVEVDHPWETVVRSAGKLDRPLPASQKIAGVFDEMKGALLILGNPGSGKTTTLLELARDLIARAEKDTTLPVPVVFNLSAWAEHRQPIAEWLADELRVKYGVPSKMSRRWIENNDLILLLDGLDEVRIEQRKACADAINRFRPEHGLTGMVICSRTKEYEELASRLKLNGAVLIQPLTLEQIERYLAAGGPLLAALGSALQSDDALQELAQAPLILSIMSLAYSGESVGDLTATPDDPIQRRKRLFNAYVDKMFARTARTTYEPYSKGETVRWLAWLAVRMSEHGQTVFLIEGMQPSWLQSQVQRRIFYVGSGLVSDTISRQHGRDIKLVESLNMSRLGLVRGLAFGLVAGLVAGLVLG